MAHFVGGSVALRLDGSTSLDGLVVIRGFLYFDFFKWRWLRG